MNYFESLKYHYKPKKGWINDPNGLVYFKGYYHVFYQHCPDYEVPGKQSICWGHARTKDFISWEELPIALRPDKDYDNGGCWSGTAIEKDGVLYIFYASIRTPADGSRRVETVSVAFSEDGINFTKHENNPIISDFPKEGGPDFRDPAVCCINGVYYLVMATGNEKERVGRLLLYKGGDLLSWDYVGVMSQWEECKYAECPSFMPDKDKFLLTASVWPLEKRHHFSIMYGRFVDEKFIVEDTASVDKGPDRYAGQVFRDHLGRNLLITWIPGWSYIGFAERDVGCMSVPRQLKLCDGKITAYPVEELWHLLTDDAPFLKRTEDGFIIERHERESVVHKGRVDDLKILWDGFVAEIFVNKGETVYTVLL